MKTQPYRGSHLPVLMKLFGMTSGPIAELGSGMYSTCYLHWACFPTRRRLVTFEDHPEWIKFTQQFHGENHEVHLAKDWKSIDLSEPWSIAFIDHDALDRHQRVQEVLRLTHAEYVVCHDAENRSIHKYGYQNAYSHFKWRWKYNDAGLPKTMVFSNVHDLTGFSIP